MTERSVSHGTFVARAPLPGSSGQGVRRLGRCCCEGDLDGRPGLQVGRQRLRAGLRGGRARAVRRPDPGRRALQLRRPVLRHRAD